MSRNTPKVVLLSVRDIVVKRSGMKRRNKMKRAVIVRTDGTKHILYDSEQEKLIEFAHIVVKNLEDEGRKVLSVNTEEVK